MKLTLALGLALAALTPCTATGLHAAESPNIILLLADDQGWTGSSVRMDDRRPDSKSDLYRTPNLERLAARGMKFSNGYAPAPNCSPTRMSIQTGKTAARLGATDIIDVVPQENFLPGFNARFYVNKPMILPLPIPDLPDDDVTIGELLKAHDSNYVTAHFGKWHMGGGSPDRHGYDFHNGPTRNGEGSVGEPDPKRTGELTDEATQFLKEQTERGGPFFMQVSYYAVHTPILAKQTTIASYANPSSRQHLNTSYAAMTDELDQSVGAILDQLDSSGFAENTYVIYTSDNGGEISGGMVTNNVPLARGKTHAWEGGIRVPFIVSGPGIKAGSQSNVPAIGYDFLPTIAEWVGATDKLPAEIDGGSLASVLKNEGQGSVQRGTEALIWYYGAYRNQKHVSPHAAIRRGDSKLIWYLAEDQTHLFNLKHDLSETTNLARHQTDVADELLRELKAYLAKVETKLPKLNPNYDPAKDPGLGARGGGRRGAAGSRRGGQRGVGARGQRGTNAQRGQRPPVRD